MTLRGNIYNARINLARKNLYKKYRTKFEAAAGFWDNRAEKNSIASQQLAAIPDVTLPNSTMPSIEMTGVLPISSLPEGEISN
jgi:hypothetical protein